MQVAEIGQPTRRAGAGAGVGRVVVLVVVLHRELGREEHAGDGDGGVAAQRRPELAGVEQGIDRDATPSLLKKVRDTWDPPRVGILKSVLCCAPRTRAQLHAANEKAMAILWSS